MTRACPLAYRASGIAVAANLNALVEGTNIPDVELPDAPAPVAAPDAVGRAPDGWSGGSAAGALVTIEVGGGTVTAVTIASRGGTLLGSQGHHRTAHVLFDRQVIAAMANKTLALAKTGLLALADAIVDLPAFPPDDGGTRSLGAADPKLIFGTAWESFGESRAAARAAVGAVAITETLPDLATSYLALRNALPLAAVDYGAPAGSGGEPEALRRLDGYEAGTRTRPGRHICGAMWKLLSLSNVGHVFGGAGLARLAPGAPADPVTRLVWIFATHRTAVRSLWPLSYGLSGFNTRNSLRYAIAQAGGLLLDDDQWQRLFTALQVTEDGEEPKYHLEVKATSSKLLDEEFRQPGSRKRGGKEEQSAPRTMALRTP